MRTALAALLALVLFLASSCTGNATLEPPTQGSASLGTSADATATPAPSVIAPPSPNPAASAASSPADGPSFIAAETFGAEGWNSQFVDVEFWKGRWIALSVRSKITGDEFEVHLWTSTDGSSWTRDRFDVTEAWAVSLPDIVLLGDGSVAIVVRLRAPAGEVGTTAAWRSTDLARWEATNLGLPAGDPVAAVAVGPRGYVSVGDASGALWFSPDGLSWRIVHEPPPEGAFTNVHAGNEGFVATGSNAHYNYFTVASGDGRNWFPADWASMWTTDIGPIGSGDWVAVAGETDFEVLWSANGLDWQPRTTLREISGFTSGIGIDTQVTRVDLVSVGEEAFMTLAWDHCCAQLSGARGVWRSSNGATWTEVDLGGVDQAVVQASATDGNTVVLGGFAERGAQAVLWISVPADGH